MAKHKAKLDLIFEGPEKQINIFFHGYTAIRSQKQYDSLIANILSAKPAGKVYLFAWRSGNFKVHALTKITTTLGRLSKIKRLNPIWLAIDVAYMIAHFKYFEKRAEK